MRGLIREMSEGILYTSGGYHTKGKMKIICIPDCHGQEHWKKAKPLVEGVDKIVFLGDLFDHPTTGFYRQMSNAKQIMKFKLRYRDKVCLCWGNHDISYHLDDQCSSYQHLYAYEIKEFFTSYKDLFSVVFVFDNWIFSHAGVSKEWMRSCRLKTLDDINKIFEKKPNRFCWIGPDNYGDNLDEGPLWIRPKSLEETALDNFNFVIGHTQIYMDKIEEPLETEHKNNGKIILIDSPRHNQIIELNTEDGNWKVI